MRARPLRTVEEVREVIAQLRQEGKSHWIDHERVRLNPARTLFTLTLGPCGRNKQDAVLSVSGYHVFRWLDSGEFVVHLPTVDLVKAARLWIPVELMGGDSGLTYAATGDAYLTGDVLLRSGLVLRGGWSLLENGRRLVTRPDIHSWLELFRTAARWRPEGARWQP